ncbi:MAG: DUF4230 domain-containing protein [Treponema sp.]|nr:DUF4230 domain-containing protein [Treponema sp.]
MNKENKKLESPKEKKNSGKRLPSRRLIKFFVYAFVLLILLGAGYYGAKKLSKINLEKKSAMVARSLEDCSELVTMKYRYSDIVSIKKGNAFSKSYSIVRYSGIIRAGIRSVDFIEFKVSGKVLEVILPEVEILGNEFSSLDVFDEQKSIFIPISTQEIFDELEESRKAAEQQAVEEGLMAETRLHTERVIKAVMMSAGFDNVIFY